MFVFVDRWQVDMNSHMMLSTCVMKVLKEHFPGVRLSHDVCAVEALPDVCNFFFSLYVFWMCC